MSDQMWQLGGWTMLHFLWAGTIVAVLGGAIRLACRRAAPSLRYTISLTTLAALVALPIATAAWLALYSPAILAGRAETITTTPLTPLRTPSQDGSAIYVPASPQVIDLANAAPPILNEPLGASSQPQRNASSDRMANPSLSPSLQGRGIRAADLVPYLPYAWLLGAPLTFALLATGLIGSERLRRRSSALTAGPAFDACERIRKAMWIARRVSVAACEGLAQPVLVGIVRPLILLPASALSGWTPEELEMVLVHELAHVRRWDNLVNLLQRIVESLLFFHPAVWLVSRQVRRDREECCDAIVVSRTSQPHRYAELLVSIAAVLPRGQAPRLAVASAMADHPLAGRIRHILKLEDEPMWISRRMLSLTVALPLTLLIATVYTAAAEEEVQPNAANRLNKSNSAINDEQISEGRRQGPDQSTESTSAPTPLTTAEQNQVPARDFQAFNLKHARAAIVTLNLEEYFEDEVTEKSADRLRFIWDADGNSIVVKNARQEQLATIRDLIELYDRPVVRGAEAAEGAKAKAAFPVPTPADPRTATAYLRVKLIPVESEQPFAPQELERASMDLLALVKSAKVSRRAGGVLQKTAPVNRPEGLENLLKDHLQASFPGGGEIMELRLTLASDPHLILQAVVDAFVVEAQKLDPAPPFSDLTVEVVQAATMHPSGDDVLTVERTSKPSGLLQPGDEVKIDVVGAFPEAPIDGLFVIEPQGTVALGATYGRVKIAGLSLIEAEKAVTEKLKTILTDVQVQITLPPGRLRRSDEADSWPPRAGSLESYYYSAKPKEGQPPRADSPAWFWDATKPKAGDTTYLYDGKTFDEWRSLWKNELNPERRADAISAMAAFARAGYGKEAAEAILDVASQYDFSTFDQSAEGKLKQRVLDVLTRATARVSETNWLPELMQRLRSDREKWTPLAGMVLSKLHQANPGGVKDAEARKLLFELASDPEFKWRNEALHVLLLGGADVPLTPEAERFVKDALTGEDRDRALHVLALLVFRRLDAIPEQIDLLFDEDEAVRRAARGVLPSLGADARSDLAKRLLAVLDDADRSHHHADAVRALGVLTDDYNQFQEGLTKPHWERSKEFRQVTNRLSKLIREGPEELVPAALVAVGQKSSEQVDQWLQGSPQPEELQQRVKRARDKVDSEAKQVMDEAQHGGTGGGLF